jgi:serine/threonine protein kinase
VVSLLERSQAALAGPYALERELGRGGMASVYLARDVRHERPVAVKVLRPDIASAMGAERFLREIRLIARLQHPHILPLYDSGEADGLLYYVMPYIDGQSLRDWLTREQRLPLDDALQIAREVAEALAYAHAQNIVHRDIKPENILLTGHAETGGSHAVVADFGLARAIIRASDERLTAAGFTLGTPAYMSPEQLGCESDLDGRSDIYSLGCVLYEMVAGEPAFIGPSMQAMIARRFHQPPPRLLSVADVPDWVDRVVTTALARSPAERYQTAQAMAQALKPSTDVPAARPWIRPTPQELEIASHVTVPIAVGGLQTARRARVTATRGWKSRFVLLVAAVALALAGGFLFLR